MGNMTKATKKSVSESAIRPVVLTGPSGVGKSTLIKMLISNYPEVFGFIVSHTSRKPRQGEEEGVDYYYVTREFIETGIEKGDFLESIEFSGNIYGTSKLEYEKIAKSGKICLFDVDLNGLKNLLSLKPSISGRYVFIEAPSMVELQHRLCRRGSENEKTLYLRTQRAAEDTQFAHSPEGRKIYEKLIINEDLKETFRVLCEHLSPQIQAVRGVTLPGKSFMRRQPTPSNAEDCLAVPG